MNDILYSESQHMTSGVFLLVLIGLIFLGVARRKAIARVSRAGLIIGGIVACVIGVIMVTLKLETVYHTRYIEHRFASVYATAFDVVSLDSVTKAEVLTYNPSDYGGWGMKGNEDTRAYNASGNKGILFTFKSGQHLLLGTQHPDSLYAHLKGYYPFTK